jgi:hypothetical protein
MELKKTTYGAGMKHPTHGEVSINRYGEWHHYPAGSKSSKAHGNSTDNFASLDKHLSSLKEEASQEEFTKEMQDQKAKFDGKKKTADIAAPASQGVVDVKEATHTEIQVIDMTDGSQKPVINIVDLEEQKGTTYHVTNIKWDTDNDKKTFRSLPQKVKVTVPHHIPKDEHDEYVSDKLSHHSGFTHKGFNSKSVNEEVEQVEERSLTEPEMKKKEEVVKSMKKGIAGFKERYGDRAKSVMYATATRIAKDKA